MMQYMRAIFRPRGNGSEENAELRELLLRKKERDTFLEACTNPFKEFRTNVRKKIEAEDDQNGACRYLLKWLLPAFLNAFAAYFCASMIHVATYYYVNDMLQWEKTYEVRKPLLKGHDAVELSFGTYPTNTSFGSLNDPVAQFLGYSKMDITALDKIAAAFPLLWFLLTVASLDLRLWTKTLLCNSILFAMKGLLGAMTTVPDSIGWQGCKERLTDEGVEWMSKPRDFFTLLCEIFFKLEAFGTNGKHLRWCADMMYSGHTFVNCLYALGLYEVCRFWFRNVEDGPSRVLPLAIVCGTAILQQVVEIYFILVSRTHYSMDIFLAVVMTFLVYTNGVVAIAAKWWSIGAQPRGDVRVAASGGDVLVPVCCVPFTCCGIAGRREHLFSNGQLVELFASFSNFQQESNQVLMEEMQLSEGVSEHDIKKTTESFRELCSRT